MTLNSIDYIRTLVGFPHWTESCKYDLYLNISPFKKELMIMNQRPYLPHDIYGEKIFDETYRLDFSNPTETAVIHVMHNSGTRYSGVLTPYGIIPGRYPVDEDDINRLQKIINPEKFNPPFRDAFFRADGDKLVGIINNLTTNSRSLAASPELAYARLDTRI